MEEEKKREREKRKERKEVNNKQKQITLDDKHVCGSEV